jgi:chorismatase
LPIVSTIPGLACTFENTVPTESGGVLAVIAHAALSGVPSLRRGSPTLRISMLETSSGRAESGRVEVWRSNRPVESGRHADLVYSGDGRYLFCAGRIAHDENYAAATEKLYLQAYDLIGQLGYPEVARMWNIVGGITEPVPGRPGTDRYRVFCQARARAFDQRGLVAENMPAATGIGGMDAHTSVYLLAARAAEITRIENPRQVPAYEYPDRYGTQSPSFARAAHVRSDDGLRSLFVSGTASIIGHESVHPGNVELQTRTTLENIAELVSSDNLRRHGIAADVTLGDLDSVKVYVKHPRDLDTVRRVCASVIGPETEILYTIADVCREDLLVEVEGFVRLPEQ